MSNSHDNSDKASTSPSLITDNDVAPIAAPSKPVSAKKPNKPAKPKKLIAPIRQRLMVTWLVWVIYRLLGLPVLISVFNPMNPDVIGGVAWQALWLLPAFILTPWILRGRSPYALLVGSMLTLVYLGASGVVLFTRAYGSSGSELVVYLFDFTLLLMINVWLFILLKRLPSMNNVVKQPRSR